MDNSMDPPKPYFFKVTCGKCQKQVKKLLKGLSGVYSIDVDGEVGKVTVKSTVNPDQLAAIIGAATCEKRTPPTPNEKENNNKEPPVATGIDQSQFFKGYQVTELQELAKTKKLKQLEVTLTRNLRMNFSVEKDDEASQKGFESDNKETSSSSSELKKADETNPDQSAGTNAILNDQSKGHVCGRTTLCGAGAPNNCADQMRNSHRCGEDIKVNYGGQCCYTPHPPPPCYHVPPPYHAYHYPPPFYQNYAAPPAKDNDDNASKCRKT